MCVCVRVCFRKTKVGSTMFNLHHVNPDVFCHSLSLLVFSGAGAGGTRPGSLRAGVASVSWDRIYMVKPEVCSEGNPSGKP